MVNYTGLTTSELDGLLTLSYLPERKGKVSFSDRDLFYKFIIAKLEASSLTNEMGKNIIHFLDSNNELSKADLCFKTMMADIHILKLAALKTYHEFEEIIKL
jgi:hypothetical protein